MIRSPAARRALATLGYIALSVGFIFLAILPLDHTPGSTPGPDLLLAATLVWVVRRPDLVPVWVIAGVFLLADFLWMKPPGLNAAAVVLATEYIRRREALTTEVHFVLEWTVAGSMIACVMIGTSAILLLFGSPTPALGPLLIKLIGTILAYPALAVLGRAFGIRKAGAASDLGFGSGS